MKVLTVNDILNPLRITSKIFGVLPFTTKNGRLVPSKSGLLQIVVYTSIYLYCAVPHYANYKLVARGELSSFKTLKFVVIVRDLGSVIQMIIAFLYIKVFFMRYIASKTLIDYVDAELLEMGQTKAFAASGCKIRTTIVILIFVVHFVYNIFSIVLNYQNDLSTFVTLVYPRVVTNNLILTFYAIVLILEDRFKFINDIITLEKKKSQESTNYPSELDVCRKINQLVRLHGSLVKISRTMNTIFCLGLFFKIGVTFLCMVGDLYIVTYMFFHHMVAKYWKPCLFILRNQLIYIFDICYLVRRTSRLCYEANRTINLLLGLEIHVSRENERNLVMAAALKLERNYLKMTAYNLFALDCPLLFAIFGTTVSYLFIMIQLDKGRENFALFSVNNSNFSLEI